MQPHSGIFCLSQWTGKEIEILRQQQYPQLLLSRTENLLSLWGGNPRRLLAEACDPDNEVSHAETINDVSLDALRQEAYTWQHSSGIREVWEASGTISEAAKQVLFKSERLKCKSVHDSFCWSTKDNLRATE